MNTLGLQIQTFLLHHPLLDRCYRLAAPHLHVVVVSFCLLLFSLVFVQLRIERLEDLRKRVRDEPPAGGKTTRIRLQLPNGSKVEIADSSQHLE